LKEGLLASDWSPAAVLPNLTAKAAIEGEIIALAPCDDPRVLAFSEAHPKFGLFISRFTDAFGASLCPVVLIVRDDAIPRPIDVNLIASFRDLVAMCTVPYGRSLASIHPNGSNRLCYADAFWPYPWMLGRDNEGLVVSTPAVSGVHLVERFHGQSSPELHRNRLTDVDKPLFDALLARWRTFYFGNRQAWLDRALFRSLNMAAYAAQLPAGVNVTLYDFGRMSALWVSAFEILAHPRKGKSGLATVYPLLESVSYLNRRSASRRYAAYMTRKKPWPRRPLSCWLYGKLYQARCDFLHGNPVNNRTLHPRGLKESIFWFTPALYRLALTGFLGLSLEGAISRIGDPSSEADKAASRWKWAHYQRMMEDALLRARQ
jgi:hypothetical protein